jgi:conjugative relaxase-like TrwC/TraI family protein
MLTIRAMSNGAGYSARHLEHSDYYAEGERVAGRWQGRGAELLGLSGEVRTEQFEALREGCNPATGQFLRQRQSATRTAADGSTQSHGRNLYDFTFSAPKSVSIMASKAGGDERLIEAHRIAVAEALVELETHAATRVRQNGANEDRTTGNVALAVYHHDTSRELDPQLHTHAVAANLTYDDVEGRWKALQASDIYDRRAYLSEVYRNALAREVRSLGYDIETRFDGKGRDIGFDIRGVSEELLSRYSQRSEQRDQAISEFMKQNGRAPTDNEVAVLVRESRADKLTEISTEEVHAQQLSRLLPQEASQLADLRNDAFARSQPGPASAARDSAAPSLAYAEEHVFERVSVAQDYDLLAEALRHGRGRISLTDLRGTMKLEETSGALLRAGLEVATRGSLDRERQMVACINRGMGCCERLGGVEQFIGSDRLRPEQKKAVAFVLDSRDFAVNIRGAAGTGKTAALEELHRALKEAGREVVAIAPTMTAAEELEKVGFRNAMTVERLLVDTQSQAGLRDKVLIVDEAGMISGRQMAEMLHMAEHHRARIVFSGDTQQIQSVEASDALRVLERESQLRSTSLTQVQRQTVREYREAIEELRTNPDRGFSKLDDIGAVREVMQEDRAAAVAEAYAQAQGRTNLYGQPGRVLVVCATHDEIGRVTDAIRSHRKLSGELGPGTSTWRHVALNWTDAQKRHTARYRPGQWLEFHRATKEIGRNEVLEVIGVERGRIVTRNERGKQKILTAKQSRCFSVYEGQAIEVSAGDRLLLMANRRDTNFRATNGEVVTVSRVNDAGGIELEDGRVLPSGYRQFQHGYAVTAHRSQGKTADAVIISADAMKKELFYVSASRARESITVVTSDKELLRDSIGRSGARQSAMELERRSKVRIEAATARLGRQQGEPRGRQAAVDQARHAARHNTGVQIGHESPQPVPTKETLRRERGRSAEWER